MSNPKKCDCKTPTVTVEEKVFCVSVVSHPKAPVIEVHIPGLRGASAIDKPFDEDPTEVYLKARGAKYGNENEQ